LSVLILSSPKDVHSQAVEKHLAELGLQVVYWRPQKLLTDSKLTLNLTMDGARCQIQFNNDEHQLISLPLEQIKSVWLRRPGLVKAKAMPEAWIERLAEQESSRALEGVFRLLPCFWVNVPEKQNEAMLKVYQLEVARQCGLEIPKTLITNDPEQALAFSKSEQGRIIYKLIDSRSGLCFPTYELPRSIPTMPFRPSDNQHLNQVDSCLHLFQERINKVSDLRVTIVGASVFAAEIKSQSEGELLDWRSHPSLPVQPFSLPKKVEEGCLLLMKKLGLSYAALDFCLDSQGNCIFLEINPDGQFLWIEEAIGLPIAEALAKLLARQVA
jgi:RimK-like ATP-grasp domain